MTAYKKKLNLFYAFMVSEFVLAILAKFLLEELIFLLPVPLVLVSYLTTKVRCPHCDTPITYRHPGKLVNDGRFSTLYNKNCKLCGGDLDKP